jgi:hypothetical protein
MLTNSAVGAYDYSIQGEGAVRPHTPTSINGEALGCICTSAITIPELGRFIRLNQWLAECGSGSRSSIAASARCFTAAAVAAAAAPVPHRR